jgi:uncharacterized protein YbbC (DUF1343 family)/CubicO group peptidase (beta-lactamase class C family)
MRNLLLLVILASAVPLLSEPKRDFSAADDVIEHAIANHDIPGAVLLVGFDGKTVYKKAYGNRALEPNTEPVTEDTVFDIASLTKLFTASAVMDLLGQGKVRLNDPVARYLPEFAQNGKQDITIRMLMTHFSGLAPDLDLSTPWTGRDEAYKRCMETIPLEPPGSKFIYSDINFEVLGFLIEKLSGESLPQAIERIVLKPLDMDHTRFLPPPDWTAKIAPTTRDENGNLMRGVVHDPTARRMGGVAGHAGLYSTADDMAKFAKAILNRKDFLTPLLIEKMTTPQQPPWASELRGLGWDIDSPFANNRGDLLPIGSFGHTGYTGTTLWIDSLSRTYVVLLTNAVHPREGSDSWGKVAVRGKLMNAVVTALAPEIAKKIGSAPITGRTERAIGARRSADFTKIVLNGIDVLEANGFAQLKGKHIGLLTNQTGIDRAGKRNIDVLAHAPALQLVKLFSVEHGISGTHDDTNINEPKDAATGLPVINVYGAGEKQRPTRDQLSGIDALVVDIQDLGVRFYTYEGSLRNFMRAAAENNIEVVVLDRPDPLNGDAVQGPVSPADAPWPNSPNLPVRHGMTLGELAQFFNGEDRIGAKLQVMSMQGWSRSDWFDSTGQLWIDPSPNMRSLSQATVYPGVALLEPMGSNISVGRGTDTPFEILGAPYITIEGATKLADYLNHRRIPGVRFIPRTFTPSDYIFKGQLCGGLNIIVTDRNSLDAPLLGLELLAAMQKFYPNDFHIERTKLLVADGKVHDEIVAGKDPKAIALELDQDIRQFKAKRAKYLIYK